jgi:hypothetical protein
MNTGGFFVVLLKKVKPLSRSATERMNFLAKESRGAVEADAHLCKDGDMEEEEKKDENEVVSTELSAQAVTDASITNLAKDFGVKTEDAVRAPNGKANKQHNKNKKKADLGMEDFIPADPSTWPPLVEEYGLDPTFPKDQFMVRASGEAKVLYFISKSVMNDLIDRGIQERVTVINSGLKGFERCSIQNTKVPYRVAQEGIQFIVPHMTKRILSANMNDFHSCVKEGLIPFDKFSESFQKGLDELSPGSFIVTLEGYEKDISKKMYLVMWRRPNHMVDCFVTKIEKEAILSKMRALGYLISEEEKVAGENSKQVVEGDIMT